MKFFSLGLIAATAALVSAGTIDVSRNNVVAHKTVDNVLNGVVAADNANRPHVDVLKRKADALLRRRRYYGDYENENERDENERDENERDENENEPDENERDENERDENENEPDEEEEDENEANESSASKVMRRWGGEDEEDEDENEADENEYEGDEDEYEADENEFKRRDLTGGLLNGSPVGDILGTDPDGEGANSNGILGGVGL